MPLEIDDKQKKYIIYAIIGVVLIVGGVLVKIFIFNPDGGLLKGRSEVVEVINAKPQRFDVGIFDDARFIKLKNNEVKRKSLDELEVGRRELFMDK